MVKSRDFEICYSWTFVPFLSLVRLVVAPFWGIELLL